jgi:MFS transporter, ACS family, hexuronate transporter
MSNISVTADSQKNQDDGEFLAAPEESAGSATGATIAAIGDPVKRVGHYRWVICALLFFAATINYIDRQVLGILKPTLQAEFGWSETDYGWIVFSFQTAYALGLLFVGRLMDRFGTKKGFALSITVWSLAAMAHAWAVPIGVGAAALLNWLGYISTSTAFVSVVGFIIVRFLLGLGEAGNFPASIKTVAEWFPKKERALATGIFNSGTNVGALVTPLLVVRGIYNYGLDRIHLAWLLACNL